MILFFSLSGIPLIQNFYFVSFLMPVIIVTSYYFNHILIPRYLLLGDYWQFCKYAIYSLIFALYAQAIIFFLSLLLFSNYQARHLNSLGIDLFTLGLATIIVILVNAFYQSVIQLQQQKKTIKSLTNELRLSERPTITIRANRKNYHIPLQELNIIESRGDYVQLHTDSRTITTKERINNLEHKLPGQFIRTHRSFIVNKNKVYSFSKTAISIGGREVPISRTYKNLVLPQLGLTALDKND